MPDAQRSRTPRPAMSDSPERTPAIPYRRYRRVAGVLAILFAFAAIPAAGCSSSSSGSSNDSSRPRYIEDYTAGDYASAYASAAAAAQDSRTSSASREHAMLIAGQAAHAMKNNSQAGAWLHKVSGSQDPLVRGKARATLGLMALEDGNTARGAELLDDASGTLVGDEAARCGLFAGDAYRSLGQESNALACYRRASESARNDAVLREEIAGRLEGKTPARGGTVIGYAQGQGSSPANSMQPPFTLQLGAFSNSHFAEQHVVKVRSQADRMALGTPKIVPIVRSGKVLHAVRVGRFTSRVDAERVRSSFPGSIIVSDS
ncbi:MAG: SPOR domain-containing protein [Phycisphaeraceae bacterium]|nr:SPOR domain-containing protein [Phycisphaerae bacterium]MBX3391820.1 SPOR domain-containing protein [Phycisphaeraceae bacterium]